MSRPVVAVLLLFTTLLIQSANGQTDYTVHTNASTWVDASQACYLATPAINVSAAGDYSVDVLNSDIPLVQGETYWVGYHKNHRVFQYEEVESLTLKVKDHPNANFVGDCITYENVDKDSHEWFWTGCSRSLHPLCEQTTPEGTRLLAEYKHENKNWMLSAQRCLNQGLFPTTIVYEERLDYERASLEVPAPSWTAMFRDQVVYIPQKGTPLPGDQCAYIKVGEDNRAQLLFSQCLEAEKMNFICQEGMATEPITFPSTENSTDSSPISGSSTKGTPVNEKLKQGQISLVVPIVVGVVCGLILIAVIVAVIICLRKRSRQKHKEVETNSIPDLEHYAKHISNMDYAIVDKFKNGEEEVDGYVNGSFNAGAGNAGNEQPPPGPAPGPAPGDLVMDFTQSPDSPKILMSPDYYDSLRTRSLKRNTDNVYNKLNGKDHDGIYNNGEQARKQNYLQHDDMYNKLQSKNSTDRYDRTAELQKGKREFVNPGYERARANDNTYNVTGGQDPDAVYSRVNKEERRID